MPSSMPSLRHVLAEHPTLLLIDSASARVQVGLWTKGPTWPPAWRTSDTEAGGVTELTVAGQFVGSLPWASPEQARGHADVIDIRTDVYSLGVILYQVLTGTFPYVVSGSAHEVVQNILSASPARPSTVRRSVKSEVETIILKCLAKEPQRRYQSAGELARDLDRYLAGEPMLPSPLIDPREVAEAVLKAAVDGGRDVKVGAMASLSTAMSKLMPAVADKLAALQAERQMRDEAPRHPLGTLFRPGEGGHVHGSHA